MKESLRRVLKTKKKRQGKQGRIFNNTFEGELLLQAQQVDFYINAVPAHRKRVIIFLLMAKMGGFRAA
jgi:hypothetical protein